MTKQTAKKPRKAHSHMQANSRPKTRGPYDPLPRAKYDPGERITKGSFRAECDINNIVAKYSRTGIIDHVPRTKPQYGDAPNSDFFRAACVNAEIASKEEEGYEPPSEAPEEPSDATSQEIDPAVAGQPEAPEEASESVARSNEAA